MGIWSSGDFALLEEQMTASAAYCANSFRYERVDGAGALDAVGGARPGEPRCSLDFLPH